MERINIRIYLTILIIIISIGAATAISQFGTNITIPGNFTLQSQAGVGSSPAYFDLNGLLFRNNSAQQDISSLAINISALQNEKVNKSGDTMAGDLYMSQNRIINVLSIGSDIGENIARTLYYDYNNTDPKVITAANLDGNNYAQYYNSWNYFYWFLAHNGSMQDELYINDGLEYTHNSLRKLYINSTETQINTTLEMKNNTVNNINNINNTYWPITYNFLNTSGNPSGEALRLSGFGRYSFVRRVNSSVANSFALNTLIIDCSFANQCQSGMGGSMLFGFINSSSESLRYMGRISLISANTSSNSAYNLSFAVRENTLDANALHEVLTISSSGNVTVPGMVGAGNAYVCINNAGVLYRATAC